MSVQSALNAGRRAAESQMTLTLTPHSPAAPFADSDGYETPGLIAGDPHAGKMQGGSQSTRDTGERYVLIGSVEKPVLEGGLHIPIDAPLPVAAIVPGKATEYVVEAVGPGDDPALLARRFMVVKVPIKSHATARRLDVVEV